MALGLGICRGLGTRGEVTVQKVVLCLGLIVCVGMERGEIGWMRGFDRLVLETTRTGQRRVSDFGYGMKRDVWRRVSFLLRVFVTRKYNVKGKEEILPCQSEESFFL